MPETKEIELLDPFDHHSNVLSKITLREPTGGLFAQLGEPRIWIRNSVGGYWVEQPDVIRQYMDKCIAHPDGSELLKLMSLVDAMKVKDAVLSFFAAAEARAFAKKSDSSSSAGNA